MRVPAHAAMPKRAGFATVLGVAGLALLVLVLTAVLALGLRERRQVQAEERRLQAAWLVEAGAERARARLEVDSAFTGETWTLTAAELGGTAPGRVEITVEPTGDDASRRLIEIRADFPASGPGRTRVSRPFLISLPARPEHEDSP